MMVQQGVARNGYEALHKEQIRPGVWVARWIGGLVPISPSMEGVALAVAVPSGREVVRPPDLDQARDTRPRAFRIAFASARLRSQITTWSLTSTIYRSSSLDCFRSSAIASLFAHDVGMAGLKFTPRLGGLSAKASTDPAFRPAPILR
jgi:hypothetical protein